MSTSNWINTECLYICVFHYQDDSVGFFSAELLQKQWAENPYNGSTNKRTFEGVAQRQFSKPSGVKDWPLRLVYMPTLWCTMGRVPSYLGSIWWHRWHCQTPASAARDPPGCYWWRRAPVPGSSSARSGWWGLKHTDGELQPVLLHHFISPTRNNSKLSK